MAERPPFFRGFDDRDYLDTYDQDLRYDDIWSYVYMDFALWQPCQLPYAQPPKPVAFFGQYEVDSEESNPEGSHGIPFQAANEPTNEKKQEKKKENVFQRGLRKANKFLIGLGIKASKNKKTDKDDTAEEETFPDVSFYDQMKETEKQQKPGNSNPSDPYVIEQKIKEAQKLVKVKPEKVEEIRKANRKKYNYDKHGKIAVTKEMLEHGIGVNQNDKLSFREVLPMTITVDNEEINKMVLASKEGNWGLVFRTLDEKPYLVNCIPEQRAWSVLHQAIFHGCLETVQRLVKDYNADINIRTKPDRAHIAEIGTNSKTLAYQLERKEIFDYLLTYEKMTKAVKESEDISYFRICTTGSVDPFCNYPLLHLTLASYKTLTPTDIVLKHKKYQHLVSLLPGVNEFPAWKDAQQKICNTLYGIDRKQSDSLRKAENPENFYREVIRVYTTESDVYKLLTPALIKQPLLPYKPLANDLALGPFAIMLSAILFKWNRLNPFKGNTYRCVCEDVTNKYEVGQTFLFLHFISTSKVKHEAEKFRGQSGTLFIFHNENIAWGPREIKLMSQYEDEDECLFPLGAEFKVLSVNKKDREINLQLLNPSV